VAKYDDGGITIRINERQRSDNQHEFDKMMKHRLKLQRRQSEAQHLIKELESRRFFAPKLPTLVLLSILGRLGKRTAEGAACVKKKRAATVVTESWPLRPLRAPSSRLGLGRHWATERDRLQ